MRRDLRRLNAYVAGRRFLLSLATFGFRAGNQGSTLIGLSRSCVLSLDQSLWSRRQSVP